MSDLEELHARWGSACQALDAVRDGRDRERQKLLANVDDVLENRFGEALRIAVAAEADADKLLRAEEGRVALEKARAKQYRVPIGTVLYEYTTRRFDDKRLWTGRKGVLEIVSEDSAHPSNVSAYRWAKIGSLVVRILKKDDSLGLSYVAGWSCRYWVPEGTDLNQKSIPNFCAIVEEGYCRADRDGDCSWDECPQLRDGEPEASGRSCPFVLPDEE